MTFLFSRWCLTFLPTAANLLNFISVVKHLPFFFHLLPFFLPWPRVHRGGAAGPGDQERAGPWHRDRSDIRDVGSSKNLLWRCSAGSRAGIGVWAGGLQGSGGAGWCSPQLLHHLSSCLQLCNLWAHLLAQIIYFVLLVWFGLSNNFHYANVINRHSKKQD